jgi:glutamyl-tRNA reductase
MESRDMVPLIRGLRDQGETARRGELDRALRMLSRGDDPKSVLEALSHGLTNKLLHAPTRALHEAAGDDRGDLAAAIDRLYRIRQRP